MLTRIALVLAFPLALLAAETLGAPVPAPSATSAAQRPSTREARREIPPSPDGELSPSPEGFAPLPLPLGEPFQELGTQVRQGGLVVDDPRARLRTTVRILVLHERGHRDRVARLERLAVVFTASDARDELAEVERLRGLEAQRFEAAQRGYERDLGPDIYRQVRAVIDAPAGALPAVSVGGARR